ncbi:MULTISPECIES: hypothetical protein [unclassified Streptomyces]|uniref:hypothetical protein n=1 Tax=unclassified Streptomyces TaxID=2593676 RepID=UPI00382E00F7
MSTTEASTKAPPDTTSQTPEPDAATVVDGPDGQSLPIEITLNQHPDDTSSSSTGRGSRSALRAWPLALFGTEAASTGASALYASAGTAGFLTAAGVAAGGGLVAAGVAAHRARKSKTMGSGGRVLRSSGHRSTLGSTGTGRSGGRTGGRGSGPGSAVRGGRSGGHGRSSTLGAVSSGASTPRTGPRQSPTSRNGASMKKPTPTGNTPSAGGGSAGRGSPLGKSGASRGRDAAGGRGGILRRLSQRRGGTSPSGTGTQSGPLDKGPNSTNSPGTTGGGRGRSTVRAWVRRAARSGVRGVALARRLGRQMAESPGGQALRERIRSVRRALAKKAKAGARYMLRSAAAKVAAGAVGAVVLIPGLLLRTLAATAGGVLRFLRLAPRNGTRWGVRFTRWSVLAATAVHKRLMRRAKDGWDKATRPDVLTDFDEPGHVRPAADEFGTDHFGGNLVSVFKQETEAVRDAYATYDPPMMLAVAAEYWGLPEGLTSAAEAVRQLAVNTADQYPADAKMADLVAQVYALLHQAVQKAQEVGPLFAKVHENDLRRYEEPRPGEHMWNILERRADGQGFDQRQPSQFVAVTQDVAHVYSRYEPGHMSQVAAEYEGIPDGIENIAAAINLLQVRSNDRYPVDKQIVDAIADVHQLLMSAASAAQELMPNFRRLHAPDISRHEAPRNGEESEAMWDV